MSTPTAEDKMGKALAIILTVAAAFILFSFFAILKILGVL